MRPLRWMFFVPLYISEYLITNIWFNEVIYIYGTELEQVSDFLFFGWLNYSFSTFYQAF